MQKTLPKNDLSIMLREANNSLKQLQNARIFITGGTGFMGKWLVEALLFANARLNLNLSLTVLTRDSRQHDVIQFHQGDVRDFIFPAQQFTHIIHAATPSSRLTHQGDASEIEDIIVDGTKHILSFADHCAAQRLLFVSSGAVYGHHSSPVDENTPINPDKNSYYAIGKARAENLCCDHANNNLTITIARCFAFVGPYLPLDQHYAIGNFIYDALHRQPITLKNNAPVYRSYQYAGDLTIWLLHILVNGESTRAYNVGSDDVILLSDLAQKMASMKNIDVTFPPKDANAKTHFYAPNIDRAKQELGLRQTHSLEEAILKTMAFYT